jgi:hypothetical protein
MSIYSKEKAISGLETFFDVKLHASQGKRIIFNGKLTNGKQILVCTAQSKLYPKGYAWVDITTLQFEILNNAYFGIFAFRTEPAKVYYVRFEELKKYLTDKAMVNNEREGDHWKLHIFPDHIKVLNNKNQLLIEPNNLDALNKSKKH